MTCEPEVGQDGAEGVGGGHPADRLWSHGEDYLPGRLFAHVIVLQVRNKKEKEGNKGT